MSSLLIRRPTVVTFNEHADILPDTSILVRDEKVEALLVPGDPLPAVDTVLEGEECVALPGFINTHTHAAMTLLRGYADDMALFPWLQEKIWPTEAKLQESDVYWGTMLAAAEMIRAGVTCFNDMYFYYEAAAQACRDSGLRACIAGVLLGILPTAKGDLDKATEFVRQTSRQEYSRVIHMLAPHAPYTCPDEMLKEVISIAGKEGVGLHIHLSETQQEVEESLKTQGKTPIAHMESLGLFAQAPVVAAHCVWPTDEDIAILAKGKVGVAHCPGSNMKLASGMAPLHKMMQAGVTVALGTDGAASNNNLDVLEEARLAALLAKIQTTDPTTLKAYQALYMATRGGAEALGLGDIIGQITPGKKADIILINMKQPHLSPPHDVVSHLVYAAHSSDVCTVLVDGKPLMIDGELQTIDSERVMTEAVSCAQKLTAQ